MIFLIKFKKDITIMANREEDVLVNNGNGNGDGPDSTSSGCDLDGSDKW